MFSGCGEEGSLQDLQNWEKEEFMTEIHGFVSSCDLFGVAGTVRLRPEAAFVGKLQLEWRTII